MAPAGIQLNARWGPDHMSKRMYLRINKLTPLALAAAEENGNIFPVPVPHIYSDGVIVTLEDGVTETDRAKVAKGCIDHVCLEVDLRMIPCGLFLYWNEKSVWDAEMVIHLTGICGCEDGS